MHLIVEFKEGGTGAVNFQVKQEGIYFPNNGPGWST